MPKYTSSEFRARLAEAIRIADTEKVEIVRGGVPIAVLVSPRVFDELHDAWDDLQDIAAAEDARAEGGPNISLEQLERDLGYLTA